MQFTYVRKDQWLQFQFIIKWKISRIVISEVKHISLLFISSLNFSFVTVWVWNKSRWLKRASAQRNNLIQLFYIESNCSVMHNSIPQLFWLWAYKKALLFIYLME